MIDLRNIRIGNLNFQYNLKKLDFYMKEGTSEKIKFYFYFLFEIQKYCENYWCLKVQTFQPPSAGKNFYKFYTAFTRFLV